MLEDLPFYVSFVFILTVIATLWLFYRALTHAPDEGTRGNANKVLAGLLLWLILQAILTLNGFYEDTSSMPPRFALLLGPPLVVLILLFSTAKGRAFLDSLPLRDLTLVHTVRIPVELVLYWLFLNRAVPELMTFAGRNFDVLSGLSAPVVWYIALRKEPVNKKLLLAWNFICLGLLVNIVANAILSVPFPLQKFAFDQPNIAILYYPFSWLAAFVVPVVLLSHLAAIRQLLKK